MAYYLAKEDKKFGVPEQKKFPLDNADHVRSAIKFFNYVDLIYEKELAKAIIKRAKEYGLDLSEMNIGDNNRFKKYLPVNELKHKGIKGWTKKNHKYISRFFKNGKWFYVYKNGKKYNRLEDWYGKDEKDAFLDAVKRSDNYRKDRIDNQSLSSRDFGARYTYYDRLQKINNKKRKAWEKTLDYKISMIGTRYSDIKDSAKSFLNKFKNKNVKYSIHKK